MSSPCHMCGCLMLRDYFFLLIRCYCTWMGFYKDFKGVSKVSRYFCQLLPSHNCYFNDSNNGLVKAPTNTLTALIWWIGHNPFIWPIIMPALASPFILRHGARCAGTPFRVPPINGFSWILFNNVCVLIGTIGLLSNHKITLLYNVK